MDQESETSNMNEHDDGINIDSNGNMYTDEPEFNSTRRCNSRSLGTSQNLSDTRKVYLSLQRIIRISCFSGIEETGAYGYSIHPMFHVCIRNIRMSHLRKFYNLFCQSTISFLCLLIQGIQMFLHCFDIMAFHWACQCIT